MSAYDPPSIISNIFNDSYFSDPNSSLSLSQADARYLKLSGGVVNGLCTFANGVNLLGSITYNAISIDLSLLSGITLGIGQASKLLSLDSNLDVSNIRNITSTGNITLSGASGHIYLSGNSSGIDLNGINSNVSINGSGGHLIVSNTEAANSTGSQGAIKCAGGAYFGQNVFFNSTSQFNGIAKFQDITNATAIGTGSLQCSGGLSIAKTAYMLNGVIDNSAGGDLLILKSSLSSSRSGIKYITDTQTWESGTRGSTASNPETFYIYNQSYKFIMQPNGDTRMTGPSDSNSSFSSGGLILEGGLSVQKNINAPRCILTSGTSQLQISNGSGTSGLIEVPGTGSTHITGTYNTNTTHVSIGDGLFISKTSIGPSRGYVLDFGAVARDAHICLYGLALNDTTSYTIGANNSAIQYISPYAHSFICNASSFPGTIRMYIDSSGKVAIGNSTTPATGLEVSNGSIRVTSQGNPSSGAGLELGYNSGNNVSNIYSFDRGAGSYKNINLNDKMFIGSDGKIGIGTTSPGVPLDVSGSNGLSTGSGFGYLSSGGSGTATGFTNRNFSIRTSSGICCLSGEIDVLSDTRLKKNIRSIDEKTIENFKSLEPITFQYKGQQDEDPQHHLGYRAQDLISKGLTQLCGFMQADSNLEEMKIPCEDGTEVNLKSDERLVVNLQEMIPLLHRLIQKVDDRVRFLETENKANDSRIDSIIDAIHEIYDELDKNNA